MAAEAEAEARIRAQPEYQAAVELERWKQAEMGKWRAEVRSCELERMALLQAEWRRREKLRDTCGRHPTPPRGPCL